MKRCWGLIHKAVRPALAQTLQSYAATQPLNFREELIAFKDFTPSSVGISSANLTVYFPYAAPGTNVFVYSTTGIQFTIE